MRYVIDHETRVHFDPPARDYYCELRLAPAPTSAQRVDALTCTVTPAAEVLSFLDYFGNRVHCFGLPRPLEALTVRVHAAVETLLANPFDFPAVPVARERAWLDGELKARPTLWDYILHRSRYTPDLAALRSELAWPRLAPGQSLLDAVQVAQAWLAETFVAADDPTRPPLALQAVVDTGTVTAVDRAHLLVALVRAWGFAARVVTGSVDPDYDLETPGPHTWTEILVPGAGWRGVDPTLHLVADATYVTIAVGRDVDDTRPWRAVFAGTDAGGTPEHLHAFRRAAAGAQQ